MIKSTITTKPTSPLVKNDRTTIAVKNPGDITEILLEIIVPVTVAAGAVPAVDGLEKYIRAISMYDENGKTLVNIQDIRLIRKFTDIVMPGRVRFDTLPTVAGPYTLHANILLHAGRKYDDYEDMSCLFPGQNITAYNIDIALGVDTDLGTGYTVGAPTITPTPTRIVYDNPISERGKILMDGNPASGSGRVFTANMIADRTTFTNTAANLSQIIEVPVARFYMKSLLMVLNAANQRSDNVVSRLCIRYPRDMAATSIDLNWTAAQQYMARTNPNIAASDLTGLYLIDWSRHKHLKDEADKSRVVAQGFNTYDLEKGVVEIGVSNNEQGSIYMFSHFSVATSE